MSYRLAKNALFLTLASVGQKLLSFVYFLLLARFLQPEKTGLYALALTLVTTCAVIADFGIPAVVIRDVAKHPDHARATVRRAVAAKIPFTLASIAAAFTAANLLGYEADAKQLVMLAAGIMAADSVSILSYGVLRGLHVLAYEAAGMFVSQLVTLSVGLLALQFSPTLPMLVFALTAGSLFNAVLSATRVAKRLGAGALVPDFRWEGMRGILSAAFPFFLAAAFVRVYSTLDIQFLKAYLGNAAVGIYSVAYKFTYAFQFLPLSFVAALYPSMSAAVGRKDAQELGRLFDRALRYMLLLSVPLAFGLSAVSERVVHLVDPSYAAAAPILSVLAFALIPSFLDFPTGSLLNASGRQSTKTALFGATLVVNAGLNFFLVPAYGMMGAASASALSLVFLVAAGVRFVPALVPGYTLARAFRLAAPIAVSGALMYPVARAAALWKHPSDVLVLGTAVVVSGVAYVAFLFLTRAVSAEDAAMVRKLFRRSPPAYAEDPAVDA